MPHTSTRALVALLATLGLGMMLAAVVLAAGTPPFAPASSQPLPTGATAGKGALNTLAAVSCLSAGNCTAGGNYSDSLIPAIDYQAMVGQETGGVWGTLAKLALPAQAAARTTNQTASVRGISCPSTGNCVAVGFYEQPGASVDIHPMYAVEQAGVWQQAQDLPLPANAQTTGVLSSMLDAVSCSGVGNCVAVGTYQDTTGDFDALIATDTNGAWTTASAQPALPADGQPGGTNLYAVTCASVGNCTAAGDYSTVAGKLSPSRPMVVTESNGTWNPAVEIGLPAAAATTADASLGGLSCPAQGACVAVGMAGDAQGDDLPLIATETSGTWGTAITVAPPSGAVPDDGQASVTLGSVSCAAVGSCVATGSYDGTNTAEGPLGTVADTEAMYLTETNGTWGPATELTLPSDASTAAGVQSAGLRVACSADGGCAGVGSYVNTQGGEEAMTTSGALALPSAGPTGTSGTSGATGTSGTSGATGTTGTSGATGTAGSAGIAGLGKPTVAGNVVTTTITCTGASGTQCSGLARLIVTEHLLGRRLVAVTAGAERAAKKKTKTVTLASAPYAVAAGASASVKLTIGRAGQALVAHRHTLPTLLTLTPLGQKRTAASRKLTLRGKGRGA